MGIVLPVYFASYSRTIPAPRIDHLIRQLRVITELLPLLQHCRCNDPEREYVDDEQGYQHPSPGFHETNMGLECADQAVIV